MHYEAITIPLIRADGDYTQTDEKLGVGVDILYEYRTENMLFENKRLDRQGV
jgi:hypothetical protein